MGQLGQHLGLLIEHVGLRDRALGFATQVGQRGDIGAVESLLTEFGPEPDESDKFVARIHRQRSRDAPASQFLRRVPFLILSCFIRKQKRFVELKAFDQRAYSAKGRSP